MSRLSQQLRDATLDLHRELEQQAFFAALADGTLPLDSYVNQLRCFAILFSTLERTMDSVDDVAVKDVQRAFNGRFRHLLDDLDLFSAELFADIDSAVDTSLEIAQTIREAGVDNPRLLLGHIYTLGGTIMGNRVHLADVRKILGDKPGGDAFYRAFETHTDEVWQTVVTLMDNVPLEVGERQQILEVARGHFERLVKVHAALYPLPPAAERRLKVTSLNPEAGNHPIPKDPEEIRVALVAGQRCRQEFPYFDLRYGDRGRRFTSSDVAWLVTLCDLEADGVAQQVMWLADLLARLGMPKYLLERQLVILVEELVSRLPTRRPAYQKLNAGVAALRDKRLAICSETQFTELSAQIEERLGSEQGGFANIGVLIVAALIDERSGFAEAAAGIEAWLSARGCGNSDFPEQTKEVFATYRAIVRQTEEDLS